MQLTQFSRVEWPPAAIRQGLLDSSVPATNVDEITDLAIQATNQASAAAFRTLDAASDLRNQLCAFGVAFSLLRNFADRMIEVQADLGEAMGSPAKTVEIKENG